MSEVEIQPTASPAAKAKKGGADKKVSKHAKPTHPPTSDMVNNAIKGLKERSGSSLQAIKKYIATNYKVDPVKFAPFIKKYLNTAVQSGSLVRTKGKGASGSFKLAVSGGATGQGKTRAVKAKKAAGDKKKKAVAAKTASTEKSKVTSATKAKKSTTVGEKKPKVPKSPSKVKKTTKAPTKKPKAPKPKTVKAVAASSKSKKVASPKKKK